MAFWPVLLTDFRYVVVEKEKIPPAPIAPKKKKEKPVPKSQVSGMGAKDVQTCRNVLKKLQAAKSSYFFRQPVDPVRDHAPG